ncbi:MAG TPA: acyl-CoA dehydrogenase family protein, partial [Ilumatobacteraceae bacterium]|nr:acyl-CoA dehydrogenase family protein [Ilumatobacteraceae bacterium]
AVPDPDRKDGWIINGQKIFTTLAHEAAYVILLTRTNTDVAKHRGLTMFLLPLDQPGIEIQPVHTMGGDRTNMTFYTDVRVGDEWRIGEVDGGWDVMKVALAYERGVMGNTNQGVRLLQRTAQWAAATTRPGGDTVLDDATVRTRLAQIAIDNEVSTLLSLRAASIASKGGQPALEGASVKLFASEAYLRAAETCLDIAGVDGVLQDQNAPAGQRIDRAARDAPVTTIYGGTSEIQRNLIAEMHLGLPKAR